jgi:hypothetical protein
VRSWSGTAGASRNLGRRSPRPRCWPHRRRLAYALLGWLNVTPRQCVDVLRHRLNGAALYQD